MYRAIEFFTDLHDQSYPYSPGDTFPRAGIKVTEKRLKALSGNDNLRGRPVIEKVGDEKEEKKRKAVRKAVEK